MKLMYVASVLLEYHVQAQGREDIVLIYEVCPTGGEK